MCIRDSGGAEGVNGLDALAGHPAQNVEVVNEAVPEDAARGAVSYTHLDVYKRQAYSRAARSTRLSSSRGTTSAYGPATLTDQSRLGVRVTSSNKLTAWKTVDRS